MLIAIRIPSPLVAPFPVLVALECIPKPANQEPVNETANNIPPWLLQVPAFTSFSDGRSPGKVNKIISVLLYVALVNGL